MTGQYGASFKTIQATCSLALWHIGTNRRPTVRSARARPQGRAQRAEPGPAGSEETTASQPHSTGSAGALTR